MAQVAVGELIYSYEKIGDAEGVPILLLHGWGRSYAEWLSVGKELSELTSRTVYALDLPGFGGSTTPKGVSSIEEYAELVFQFCSYMEIKKVIVVGHSLGGRLGIILAAHKPSFVEKLILVDPAGVKPWSMRRIMLTAISALFKWVPTKLRRKLTEKLMDEDYQNTTSLRELYRVVVKRDLRTDLPLIKCKVGVIWGEIDNVLPTSLVKVYSKLLSDCQIRVVWGAGHDPHLSHFSQTLEIMEEML